MNIPWSFLAASDVLLVLCLQADILALALLSYHLQECNVLSHPDHFYLVVELQYYCQVLYDVFDFWPIV